MTADIFIRELKRLLASQPKRPSQILNSESSDFGNNIYYGKNLFNCFDCSRSTDVMYATDSHNCVNCADIDFTFESEICYECVSTIKGFNSTYLEYCENMTDSDFCYDCRGCHDVFGCVHLDNKSFCIFNRQFTEAEYWQKLRQLKMLPAEKILSVLNDIKKQHPVTQTHGHHNENSQFGNYGYYNRNCYLCFDSEKNENCGYLYDAGNNKYTYDLNQSIECELSYEVIDSGSIFNSDYIMFSKNCIDSSYLFDCFDVKNSIGCVMLSHREYCILNRQFEKEEYEKIVKPLLGQLREKYIGRNDIIY